MKWGDAFAEQVPRWVPKPRACSCSDLRRKMNLLDADIADELFDTFLAAIIKNASGSMLALLPGQVLSSEIEKRLNAAYLVAFGLERGSADQRGTSVDFL